MRVANASRALRRAAILLACASAFAACSSEPARKTIEVKMRYSKYLPGTIAVKAGTTIDFVVVNDDPIAHEFIIGTEADQKAHEKGKPGDPHTGPGEASIPANETVHLSYTFARAGTMLYACHVPGHYTYGMRGTVQVT
ncbi:MAG: cupredoxin domain-containing protein [Actinomycetota bacterium]